MAKELCSILPFDIEDELISLLNIKGNYEKILAMFLDTFYKELYEGRNQSNFSTYELQQVRKASEWVTNTLEQQHNVKSICKQSGLSPAKLQAGFKFMHGTTVSDFIRNKRLDRAETLFCTTDCNVSQVVYMVGITSRSYFCKIFKARFGDSPSAYIKLKRKINQTP